MTAFGQTLGWLLWTGSIVTNCLLITHKITLYILILANLVLLFCLLDYVQWYLQCEAPPMRVGTSYERTPSVVPLSINYHYQTLPVTTGHLQSCMDTLGWYVCPFIAVHHCSMKRITTVSRPSSREGYYEWHKSITHVQHAHLQTSKTGSRHCSTAAGWHSHQLITACTFLFPLPLFHMYPPELILFLLRPPYNIETTPGSLFQNMQSIKIVFPFDWENNFHLPQVTYFHIIP